MIDYPRGRWVPLTLAWRGTVLPRTLGWVVVLAGLAAGLQVLAEQFTYHITLPPLAHNLIGVALGLLLVFRTNASYERYWDGRRQWGGIVNASRNLVRAFASYLPEFAPEMARLAAAFPLALKQRLRGNRDLTELPEALRFEGNTPLLVTRAMSRWIAGHHASGALTGEAARALEGYVAQLVDHQGACERILRTPIPFAYVVHIRQMLLLYLLSLPYVLVPTLGWLAPAAVAFITMGLLGIEEIGVEIEEPFGTDPNDLPIEAMCSTIERDVKALVAP